MLSLRIVASQKVLKDFTSIKHVMSTVASAQPVLDNSRTSTNEPTDKSVKPFESIPGPTSHPVIHNLKNFMPIFGKYSILKRYKYFEDLQKTYGKVVKEKLVTGIQLIHLFDPKDFEVVFRNTMTSSLRPALESMKSVRLKRPDIFEQPGIFVLNGPEWKRLRQKFQVPMLQANSAEMYCSSMDIVAQEFISRIGQLKDTKGEVPNVLGEFYKWALESIGLVIFNTRLGCLDSNLPRDSVNMKLVQAVTDTFDAMNKLETGLQMYRFFPTLTYRKLEKAQLTIANIARDYINKALEKLKDVPEDSDIRKMILVKLLSTGGTTLGDVIVMINDLLMAGVDTTSHSTVMTLYHLAKNPKVQEKLVDEINSVLPDPRQRITPENIQEMKYLRSCVKETMRLTPIVDGNVRIADKEMVIAGYQMPAMAWLIMHGRVIGKTAFENPDQFIPERWLREESGGGSLGHHPFAMLPFGFGLRMCLGRRFAEQEMHLLLCRIIQSYKVEYHYEDIEMSSRFANIPDKPPRLSFAERQL